MNTLKYISLENAVDGRNINDGSVIVAHAAQIERTPPAAVVLDAEAIAGHKGWKKRWDDGVYHYELLVARQGVTELVDANGDPCGFRVNGTNRGVE